MRYLIYDQEGNKLGPLQNAFSIQWNPKYSDRGQAEIHAYPTETNRKLLVKYNRIVCVERKEILFIKYIDNEDNSIVVKGYLDNLDERINTSTATIRNVEESLYWLINTNKRGLNVETAPLKGLSFSIDPTETTYDELYVTVTDVCTACKLGFKEYFRETDAANIIELYEGRVKNEVRFSDSLGNIFAQKYIEDATKYKNYAYVLGEGDGSDRKSVIVNRVLPGEPVLEVYIDARDLQKDTMSDSEYLALLTNRGNAKLDEMQASSRQFSFDMATNSVAGTFGKDYDLGDVVPVLSKKYGLYTYARVTGANFIEEEGKGLRINIEVELERQESIL